MNILAVDVGGTHIKVLVSGESVERKADSGPSMTGADMVDAVKKLTADWTYDAVSIGYPGPVVHDVIVKEPANLGRGWVGFDFAAAFGHPVKVINDAAMQALGSDQGGRMLFLGLGTGLGSAMVVDGRAEPLELAHLPYKDKLTYEDLVGLRGQERLGKKKWRRQVLGVIADLSAALAPDYVVIGGGNSKQLDDLPPNVRLGDNANAFRGGFALWTPPAGVAAFAPPAVRVAGERRVVDSSDALF